MAVVGTQEVAPYTRGVEIMVITLTGVGVLVSSVAAYAAIRSVVLTKRGLETQQERFPTQY